MIKRISYLSLFLSLTFLATNSFATTYYVSSVSGNDLNLGIDINSPWKTLNKVNSAPIVSGDSILFKRGESWRGQLIPQSGSIAAVVYYGAFSTGDKPSLLGSENYSNQSDWLDQGGNIWQCINTFGTDIGNIIFDNEASVGYKKWNQVELQNQDDFWYDLLTGQVLMYSTSNPATIHSEIELALREHIISQQNTSFVTYENLSLKYGGAHGFGGGNTADITIMSCEISYIGGGDLDMDGIVRFGNGVEFWGNASNNTVEKCKIWEIYDTGLSNQNHTSTATQQNIRYRNNIIWNCGMASFEYWNKPVTSTTAEIYFENNTCLNAGSGWGIQRSDYHGIHVVIDSNPAQTDSIFIRNNIFYVAQRTIYAIEDNMNGYDKLILDHNLIYQPNVSDTLYARFPSITIYPFSDYPTYSSTLGHDINSVTEIPLFVDLANLDLHLTSFSPCINTGYPVDLFVDFDGNSRPLSGAYDIGAYEYDGIVTTNNLENNTDIAVVYPNPARDFLQLLINDDNHSSYSLIIHNSLGKKMCIIEDYKSMDIVNTNLFPKGIYFLELIENGEVLFKEKCLILD